MRLKTLLVGGMLLALAIVSARLAMLGVSTRENERIDRLQRQAELIARDAANLQALSHDYILRRSARAAQQWRATQGALLAALAAAQPVAGSARPAVDELAEIAEGLPQLFDALPAGPEHEGSFVDGADVMVDHLVYQTRLVSESAFDLGEAVARQRKQWRTADRQATLAANIGFATLTLLLTLLVARRLMRPAAALARAAQAIGKGQLDARSGYRAADELGALSSAFDGMAQALQEREHSLAEARRDSESLLNALHMNAIVSVADRAGRIIEVNDAFCRISGYTRPELLGQNHRILHSGVQPPEFWRRMWQTIASGQPWRGTVCNRAKDGSLYWVDSFIAPFVGADGRIDRYVSIRIDVTEAKNLEKRLVDSEHFLRYATDALPMRVTYVDAQRVFRFVNLASLQSYGATREAVVGHHCTALLGDRPDHPVRQHMEQALAGQEQHFEYRQEVAGQVRHFEMRMIPDIGEDGQVRGALSTGFDVTERKRVEIELGETTALLRTVLDSATEVAIVVTEVDGRVRLFNPGAERLWGRSAASVVGREGLHALLQPGELAQMAVALAGAGAPAVPVDRVLFEPALRGQAHSWTCAAGADGADGAGAPRRASLVVTPMTGAGGVPLGYLAVAHDVTEREHYEATLREAMVAAQQADLAKSAFLANMSHEIRTPMNGVMGLTYLLEQTRLDAEQARYLRKMRLAGKTLLRLLNDILDLSKIEAGELTLESVPFKLRHLLRDVAELASTQAEAKGLGFSLQLSGALPAVIVGDPVRLGQVLNNLLTNAVKFTEHGTVALRIQPLAAQAGRVRLQFCVADTGVGIEPDAQQRIFMPFVQADTSVTRRFGGTGLGLSIVRHLVERMQGTLALRSSPGHGSEFTVELDFVAASSARFTWQQLDAAGGDADTLAGVRVLVVDDSDINRDVAERILQLQGARVTTAVDGQQACDLLRAHPQGFDVVLMDVQMPRLDGFAATRCIRQELGLTTLPVIALTAAAISSELENAHAAGMSGFVSKPFEPQALVRTVRGHMAAGAASGPPAPPSAGATPDAGPGAWPEIEGIDSELACSRLGGDLRLFVRLLRRLLSEDPAPGGDAAAPGLAQRAHEMHRLRGAAATLGAMQVSHLAGEVEAACGQGDGAPPADLLEALADELALLRRHAEPALAALDAVALSCPLPDPAPATGLEPLVRLLREHDMAAVTRVDAMRPTLERSLGAARMAHLQHLVDELQFAEAAEFLAATTEAEAQ